jgi:hypothetical protein
MPVSVFVNDPAWKNLATAAVCGCEIMSNITNLYLSPLGCSQI